MAWDDPSGTFSDQSGTWTPTGDTSGFGGYGGGSMWNPSNWFTSDQSGTFSDPTGTSSSGGGGMNWAGLSQGLGKLTDALKSSGGAASSDPMQGSKSVVSTVSGGQLQPAGGRDSGGLASMLNARNQLGQALINAAMTGKGRGRSGGGLLG